MNTTQDLRGKVAIVTGGGTGIGRAVAEALAQAGVKVCLSGRRVAPLDEALAAIRSAGGEAMVVSADVAVEAEVERLVAAVIEAYGRIDMLINNAGIGGGAPIERQTAAEWDAVMAVNLRGPFLTARAVLPYMRQQGAGEIVNISSEAGLEHYPGNGAYGVSKHALNDLGEYIQRENQTAGVRVATICPGMVVTPMSAASPGLDLAKCLYPADIADLVLWLVSRRPNVKIGRPILIQTMANPWE